MEVNIINELLEIEAWAEGLRKKCYETRKKMEGVSTSSPDKGMDHVAAAIARRKLHLLKKKLTGKPATSEPLKKAV